MRFLNTILNIIYPVSCIACGKNGSDFCLDCLLKAPGTDLEKNNWIYTLYDYRHPPIKSAIWFLKYKGKRNLAKIFAEIMYGRIIEELEDLSVFKNFREPILIPIPLAPARKRERGFNQAELLCKHIIKLDLAKTLRLENNILIKPKDTEHQAKLKDRNKRLKNIVGSFAIKNPEKIKGQNIILIDDVTTTGATLSEARKILKQAGAKKIIAFHTC